MKPLLIFGLRGTLVERIHVRRMPSGMPQPDLTVGLSKVWLRPQMLATLLALQEHCNLALWSSTTQRNTNPLVEAVFRTQKFYEDAGISAGAAAAAPAAEPAAQAGGAEGRRFSTRRSGAPAAFECPLKFQFIWSREHTRADDYRRRNAVVDDDGHATVKDLTAVFQQFPEIAQPHNTVLIDDTPSKAKHHAGNFLWLDTCEGLGIADTTCMPELKRVILDEVCKARDVRDILPLRVRGSAGDVRSS